MPRFREFMDVEWKIMRSIAKHTASLASEILKDIEDDPYETTEIIEGIARLMEMRIIEFSFDSCDFKFRPEVASSGLVEQVKKSTQLTISEDEYRSYGWKKLAGLM